jgi:hypothetical protein
MPTCSEYLNEDCKENIWTFITRMLVNKNQQGDKGHITRGRYYEIYKSPPTNMYGHVERMQFSECQNTWQQLQWKEQGKGEDHIKDGGMRLERI